MSAPCNLPCVPLAILYASILSLVISSSVAIVPLLCQKSVKCQHPWQKATSFRLLCSAVSCGILAQVLLALPQFVIVGSGCQFGAPTQSSSKGHLRQHHDDCGDGGECRTSVGVSNVRTHEQLQNSQLLESTFLTCCSRLVPLRFVIVFPYVLNFSASPWSITPENLPAGRCLRKTNYVVLSSDL